MKKLVAVLLSFLMVFCLCSCGKKKEKQEFDWYEVELKDQLPEPQTTFGEIRSNSQNYLAMDLYQVEKSDYRAYKSACQTFGYTIDSNDGTNSYDAFNADGYKLRLYFYESNEEISISLDAPEKMGEISWPTNGAGSLLPVPESNTGKIVTDSSDSFRAYVGEMPTENFLNYIKACEDAGFVEDYNKTENSYSAKNADGYKIRVNYEGFHTICISIETPSTLETIIDNYNENKDNEVKPSDDEAVKAEEPVVENKTSEPKKAEERVNGMRKEFKEAMDSYENFMDSYVNFMKNYDSSSVTALVDYAKFLSDYAEVTKKFEKWDDGAMNDVELAYYLQVQNRVNQKLLEII